MDPWEPDPFDRRRRYARREVHLHARLRLGESEIDAIAENICQGGAFFRVQVPQDADDVIASIELPHGRGLYVHAKVRWRQEEPAGIGVEFDTFLADPWEALSRSF